MATPGESPAESAQKPDALAEPADTKVVSTEALSEELSIKIDENGEIDLDALFAGDFSGELEDTEQTEQPQPAKLEQPAGPEQPPAEAKSEQATEQQPTQPTQTAEQPQAESNQQAEPNQQQSQPTQPTEQKSTEQQNELNDVENDPLFSVELPADTAMQDAPFQTKEEAERERMKLLVSHFDEQQMSRYAAYRRANIRRASIKKFAGQLLNQPITNSVALVLGGMSKVLIGDIIELARDLQDKDEAIERKKRNLPDPPPGTEPEPLLPSYVREAWRIYKRDTRTVPGTKTTLGSMNRMF